jgi:hypothetical protein
MKYALVRKWLLALAGLSFALAFTSCDEQAKKNGDAQKSQREEKHSRRW